ERDAVLAPVQVLVRIQVRILVVQLTVQRPVRADELAQASSDERRIAGAALVVLDVEASGTGDVPAVVVVLRCSSLRERQAGEQSGAQQADLHTHTPWGRSVLDRSCDWVRSIGSVFR